MSDDADLAIPEKPRKPALDECCDSGCDPCVWDFYNQELAHYRKELALWLARHPDAA